MLMLVAIGRLFLFVLIGVLTAAVGELQYSVFIRGDWANLFGSMFFNSIYLIGAFGVTRLIYRRIHQEQAAFLLWVAAAGAAGLMVEWFLIGNSPWGNPDASQIGMAAYWASFVIVPLIMVDPDPRLRSLKRLIAIYALVYTLSAIAVQITLPNAWPRNAYHIWSVILGYIGLAAICVVGYLRAIRLSPVAAVAAPELP